MTVSILDMGWHKMKLTGKLSKIHVLGWFQMLWWIYAEHHNYYSLRPSLICLYTFFDSSRYAISTAMFCPFFICLLQDNLKISACKNSTGVLPSRRSWLKKLNFVCVSAWCKALPPNTHLSVWYVSGDWGGGFVSLLVRDWLLNVMMLEVQQSHIICFILEGL